MEAKYQQWISENVKEYKDAYGQCHKVTSAMKEVFPELTVVKGHYFCAWGDRDHCWLTAPDGTIVDPTVIQFPGLGEYKPWNPGDEVRVGRCMNCGDDIWRAVQSLTGDPGGSTIVCSKECEDELSAAWDGK